MQVLCVVVLKFSFVCKGFLCFGWCCFANYPCKIRVFLIPGGVLFWFGGFGGGFELPV